MWVTAEDVVADWIGDDKPAEDQSATIERWIGRAERLVRREFPDIQARIDADTTGDLLDTVKDVVSAMTMRVLRNPAGVRTQQETAGVYSTSVTFGGNMPGEVYMTSAEHDALSPATGAGRGSAYSISINPYSTGAHLPWCSTVWGASCSCGTSIAGVPIFEGAL